MTFEFASATRICFGPGNFHRLESWVTGVGKRALVVRGKRQGRALALEAVLRDNDLEAVGFSVPGEPDLAAVRTGTALARSADCDFVIGIGGGSVVDAGKAIAAMVRNPGDILDYLEVIGAGRPLRQASARFIAIPTTAGTGSEVTRNAVLSSPEHRLKVSLRSPLMLPALAVVDPELTYELPPALTASTGLDALTQLIEPFTCNRANPLTDAICREGMRRVARSLRLAVGADPNAAAREDMSLAGLFGGLALANAGLGAAHGFAAPIGGRYPAPHGAVCAALLPAVLRINIQALRRAKGELDRYDEVAKIVTGSPLATADDGVQWITELVRELGIPGLKAYGVKASDGADLVAKAKNASSMKANPIELSAEEMMEILQASL